MSRAWRRTFMEGRRVPSLLPPAKLLEDGPDEGVVRGVGRGALRLGAGPIPAAEAVEVAGEAGPEAAVPGAEGEGGLEVGGLVPEAPRRDGEVRAGRLEGPALRVGGVGVLRGGGDVPRGGGDGAVGLGPPVLLAEHHGPDEEAVA